MMSRRKFSKQVKLDAVRRLRSGTRAAEIARALEAKVWPLLAAGEVKPIIHSTFPLAQAADAHRLMESSAHIGKIILEIA